MEFLSLKELNAPFEEELVEAAERVIRSGRYLHGPETEGLEEEMARVCGAKHCVAVSNGLDAIRLSLRALMETGRLQKGDEVMVPANTYIASVLPVSELGLRPIMIEPSPETFNMDSDDIRRRLTERTRALLTVHLYGTPCWDAPLMEELRNRGIWIVEDNAQAIGALAAAPGFNDTDHTGGLGHIAATSFYPTKNVGALGDAGAVTTSDPILADTVRSLANYGTVSRYANRLTGYNNRMDEIQAAMLRVKLRHVDELNDRRREAAAAYSDTLDSERIIAPKIFSGMRQVWHQFVVRIPDGKRDEFRNRAMEKGIPTDIHYPIPPHLQECYFPTLGKSYPATERLATEIVSLPIANVTPDQARRIATVLNTCVD